MVLPLRRFRRGLLLLDMQIDRQPVVALIDSGARLSSIRTNTSSFWRGFAKPGGKVEAEDRGSVRRCEGWPDPHDPENAAGYRAGARNKRCVE
jgi:hypothetical protein